MNYFEHTVKMDYGMMGKRLYHNGSVLCDVSISGKVILLYPMHRYNRNATVQVTHFLTDKLGKNIYAKDLDIIAHVCKVVGHALYCGSSWYCV